MAESNETDWLRVIGKALSYLCVQAAAKADSSQLSDLPSKVRFLEGIGMSTEDAAQLLGTTANSVKTNLRAREKRKEKTGGKKSKR